MIKKPIQLIVLFAALFTVLTVIQVYFLVNSYSLKKREIFSEVKAQLGNLEENVNVFKDDPVKDDSALERLIELENGVINEVDLRKSYRKLADRIQPYLTHYVDSVFAPSGYKIYVQKQFTSIFSHNKKKELIENPVVIYQTLIEPKNKLVFSAGRWETSSDSKNIEHYYSYTVKHISYFEISNLQSILFRELIVLIVISVFILAAILILFYKSYQNLLKQLRQIENLHDIVDNVAHEFRTPVATLKLVAKTLERETNPEAVNTLGRQVDRLERLLVPLAAQSFSESQTPFLKQDFETYLRDFQFVNPGVSIFAEQFPESKLKIWKQDMEIIFSNLLNNSVKYGASKINLRFSSDDYLFRIIVEDNGSGISKEQQPYIFEKFYRIQKDNIHQTTGLGLGLYIVSKLVEKYKGKIWVDGNVSKWTVFQITIPNEL